MILRIDIVNIRDRRFVRNWKAQPVPLHGVVFTCKFSSSGGSFVGVSRYQHRY